MCSYIYGPFFTKFQPGCSSSTCSCMRVFTVVIIDQRIFAVVWKTKESTSMSVQANMLDGGKQRITRRSRVYSVRLYLLLVFIL